MHLMQEMEDLSGCNKLHMSLFHETSLREIAQLRRNFAHVREACALKRELASQQRQNADTLQQLSALQEEKSFLVDEVVVRRPDLGLWLLVCFWTLFDDWAVHSVRDCVKRLDSDCLDIENVI